MGQPEMTLDLYTILPLPIWYGLWYTKRGSGGRRILRNRVDPSPPQMIAAGRYVVKMTSSDGTEPTARVWGGVNGGVNSGVDGGMNGGCEWWMWNAQALVSL